MERTAGTLCNSDPALDTRYRIQPDQLRGRPHPDVLVDIPVDDGDWNFTTHRCDGNDGRFTGQNVVACLGFDSDMRSGVLDHRFMVAKARSEQIRRLKKIGNDTRPSR